MDTYLLKEKEKFLEKEIMRMQRDYMKEFNYAPLINFISEINITQIDNVKDIDLVMPSYHFLLLIIQTMLK